MPESVDEVAVVTLDDQTALKEHAFRKTLGSQTGSQTGSRRRVAQAEHVNRALIDAPLRQLPPCPGPRRRPELFPKKSCRHLVHLQQRLAEARVLSGLLARLLHLWKRNAELLRHQPHGVGEPEILVQLQEFEDVSVLLAAETVEVALVVVDRKGRRFLGVERAEPF